MRMPDEIKRDVLKVESRRQKAYKTLLRCTTVLRTCDRQLRRLQAALHKSRQALRETKRRYGPLLDAKSFIDTEGNSHGHD